MSDKLRNFYLESQVKNATPGQMLIMLYDGLIDQAEIADREISSLADMLLAANSVSRCINILNELNTCLIHSEDPALCATLSDLYLFFTKEFSTALEKRDAKKIRAILPLIRKLRGAWHQADRTANKFQPVNA
jgi:flagellar biosynthetic protein FliS